MKHALSFHTRRFLCLLLTLLAFVCNFSACLKTDDPETPVETTAQDSESADQTETTEELTTAEETVAHLYYVKTEWRDDEEPLRGVKDNLKTAISLAEKNKQYGYRVFDEQGNTVYLPYTELQCDILREAKRITDYCRENEFVYGDAPVNPAINHKAKKVSCDRLVCWVLYNLGYTDQPRTQGVTVWNIAAFCEKYEFEKITDPDDLQPGDVVLVNPDAQGRPGHTFLCGSGKKGRTYYRYDCGSNQRIQSVQPFKETIDNFICAYRPNPNTRTDAYRSVIDQAVK